MNCYATAETRFNENLFKFLIILKFKHITKFSLRYRHFGNAK